MNFGSMRLSTRLSLAFGIVLMLSILSSAHALWTLAAIQADLDHVVNETNVKATLNKQMSDSVGTVSDAIRTALLLADPQEKLAQQKKLGDVRLAYDKARTELEKFTPSQEGKAIRAEIDAMAATARPLNDQVMALAMAGQVPEATAILLHEARPAVQRWQHAIEQNFGLQAQRAAELYATSQRDYDHATTALVGGALLSAVIALVLTVFVVRSVGRELGGEPAEVAALARAVAGSDLSTRIDVKPGDTTSVVAGMARMQASLSHVVSAVRSNAQSVAVASAEIAQGNLDLSSRTEQQSSALQQTAASMEQLGSNVKHNADNSRQANQFALGASEVAVKGGEVVAQVVGTMKGINDSSRRIVDIIAVIDGIAFQTNILALNAAVEAARAGEQGRGFAVVASEVRSLAQRSAAAAKEIKGLITESVDRVQEGTALVDRAGETMGEIVASIRRVTDIMGEISAASLEQATGVSQVGEAVTQMDQATQQNAALVEESAAAAESLKTQSQALLESVAVFRLADGAPSVPAAPTRPQALPVASRPEAPAARPDRAPSPQPARLAPAKPAAVKALKPAQRATPVAPVSDANDWETF